jgi:hypothetical protein
MDPTLLEQLQNEESLADDAEAAENARIEARILDLHTSIPGHVVSYDATKQTAVCQPGIQRIFRGQGAIDLPQLVDCPVHFPSGGGFVLSFPVSVGDECLLIFSERAIDYWWQNGGVQLPAEYRTHDLSDAFAFVGVSSLPHVPAGLSASAVELRAVDGSSKVSLGQDGSITVTSKPGKDVSLASGSNVNVSGSMVLLNASPGATPLDSGVVRASYICPFTGSPHVGSTTVLAGP